MSQQDIKEFDLSQIIATPVQDAIPSSILNQILSAPPFIAVEGAFNVRDISNSTALRPGLVFRSGALGNITPAGKVALVEDYGIRTVYDLRTRAEREARPSPDIEGIETVWVPSTIDDPVITKTASGDVVVGGNALARVGPADFVEDGGKTGFLKQNSAILEDYKRPFRAVLLGLRDTRTGILIHCTAGKDRTGALVALILGLVGTPIEAIAVDYALTRVGYEPVRESLMAILVAQMGEAVNAPGMTEMGTAKQETMFNFMNMLQEKYGGVEGYVKKELNLTDEDIQKIINNLK